MILYDILLTTDSNILGPKLEQIETFSSEMRILNPIYATGNLYKGIYSLIDEKVYSSVTSRNATAVFDYLGIKWSTEKVMTLQACGDYLSFYQRHYQWQQIFKKVRYLDSLLEMKRKREEEKLSCVAASNSNFLQGILLQESNHFHNNPIFIEFCRQLWKQGSPLLVEPDFLQGILEVLKANENTSSNLEKKKSVEKNSIKMLQRLSHYPKE